MALNACVAPTVIVEFGGSTNIAVSVGGGGGGVIAELDLLEYPQLDTSVPKHNNNIGGTPIPRNRRIHCVCMHRMLPQRDLIHKKSGPYGPAVNLMSCARYGAD